jgi:predicted Zn-dependent protease
MKARNSNLFLFFLVISFAGCSTEYNLATRQQESLLYGTDKEVKIGDSVAQQVESQYKVVDDVDVNDRVQLILGKIVAVCDRRDVVYFIKVLDDESMNAVSLPGGYIYIFKGLIDKIDNDDELAGVIAHEVGHITAKHAMKKLQAAYGALLLQVAAASTGSGKALGATNLALASIFTEYSQQDEFQADQLGVKYMKLAGFNPQGMVGLLKKLREEQEKAPIRQFSYWRTHPYLVKRVAVVNQEITGKLEFKDYLNLAE